MRNMVLFLAVFTMVFSGCYDSEYDRLVQDELSKGQRFDSLFLGINFNMGRKEFYTHAWDLNKEGLIRQGPTNLSVQYVLKPGELKYQGVMNFYPKFDDDNKIYEMPAVFHYEAWAPWNEAMQVEHLLLDVKDMLERWYDGNKFIYYENKDKSVQVWVKVDGNRRIRLYREDISKVKIDIRDLLHPFNNKED